MNLEQARFNMVAQQIRPWEVFDDNVLDLFMTVRREEFVPPACRELAFADIEVPLMNGRKMLFPKIEARILESVKIRKSDNVLVIGAGSGFLAALCAARAEWVRVVEIDTQIASFAQANLDKNGVQNCIVEDGDGANGWSERAPYNVIIATGSVPVLPEEWLQQLAVGGRMFVVIGDGKAMDMQAMLITKTGEGEYHRQSIFETYLEPLVNAPQVSGFSF